MGNNQSNEEKEKTAASAGVGIGLIVTSIICPPVGAAMTTVTLGTGIGMRVVGNLADIEGLKEAGEVIQFGAEIGGVGNVATRVVQGSHGTCSKMCESVPKVFK